MQDFGDAVAAAGAGDERAFAVLWRAHHAPMLRYLRTMIPGHAEDIASDVWIEIVRSLRKFRGDEIAFRAWLFTLARRRMIDQWRRDARRPVRLSGVHATDLEWGDARGADAADVAMENFNTDAALRLIATLPPEQAEIIVLRSVAGFDVSTVASLVGKSPGAVRVATHRGLRALSVKVVGVGKPVSQG